MPLPMIAAGHDNIEECLPLDEVGNRCLFKNWYNAVDIEWKTYESREMNGVRKYKPIGDASAKWKFEEITNEEWNYFATDLADGEISVDVTVYTYNGDDGKYHWYNAIMHINSPEPDTYVLGRREKIEIEFTDLELLF